MPSWEAYSPSPRQERPTSPNLNFDLKLQGRKHLFYIKMSDIMWACYELECNYLKRRNIKPSIPGSHFGLCPPNSRDMHLGNCQDCSQGKNLRNTGRGQVKGGQQTGRREGTGWLGTPLRSLGHLYSTAKTNKSAGWVSAWKAQSAKLATAKSSFFPKSSLHSPRNASPVEPGLSSRSPGTWKSI